MKKISVMNYKGGVGKTSVTANLASQLAWEGYKVLLLDMDAQASLTFSFIEPQAWRRDFADTKTIKQWFDAIAAQKALSLQSLIFTPERVNRAIAKAGNGGKLDLVASHLGLINVDLELATQLGGASLAQAKQNYLKVHRRLAEGLDDIPKSDYDIALFDCPPNFNVVTKNAIVASDAILVPAKPDYLSTMGIDYLARSVKLLVNDYNEFAMHGPNPIQEINPTLLGVVFTMIGVNGKVPVAAQRPFIAQTKKLGIPVFDRWLRENKTIYADAPEYSLPVVLHHTTDPSHKLVISELEELAQEFERKVGLS